MSNTLERWDKVVEDLQARANRAKAIRDVLADPALTAELMKVLGVEGHSNGSVSRRRTRRRTVFSAIRDFFVVHGNEWVTATEIADGISANRDSVRSQIYKDHKSDFERRAHPDAPPGKSRLVQLRLKPHALAGHEE